MERILVIEGRGDPMIPILKSLKRLLPGADVIRAQEDADGLRMAREELPDVVLLGVGPREEGLEICRRLKADKKTRHIPVVMVSSDHADPGLRTRGLELGADVFLIGTVDEEELAAQVKALLRTKGAFDRLCREKASLKEDVAEKAKALQERTHDLAKRVKELDCLYGISELRERPGISLEEVLQGVAELIQSSWQYPEITCARILLGYQEFTTRNFRETPWKQSCDIMMHGEWAGTLEVYYLERPENEVGPFLKEEASLLNAIAERLGRIAERVHAEEALHLESENLINILKSMEDWVYKVDDQYRVEYVNPALEKEFGPSREKRCFEYFHNREEACPGCKCEAVFRGETVHREYYFPKNQKTYDVLDTPLINPDGSISKLSIFRDLTAVAQAQKALEERELLYRSVTESAADGAVMVQDGRILFVNHAFVTMLGYREPGELAGRDIVQLFDSDFRGLFGKVFNPEERDSTLENLVRGVCVTKDGRKFWVSTNRRVIRLKSKPAILATMRDITEDMLQEETVQEVAEHLRKENIKLRSSIKERYRFGDIVGKSLPMQNVYELILKAAGSEANVIILGESGTGKELVARAIHRLGARADNAFVPVNCGAIPETLVESEFFGHRKGAFTGAHIDKNGYLHTASGGTLFLDEVGELGLNIQVKLLRALEIGDYTPVGDTLVRKSDLRIISATNRDFDALVGQGRIRDDFYYRISVIPIILPPLREKKEDIPLLIEHFLRMFNRHKKIPVIPGKIMEVLHNYHWPGNVRELQSVVQRYLAVGNFDFLTAARNAVRPEREIEEEAHVTEVTDLRRATNDFEKRLILEALNQNRWHRGKVAAALKIDPKTLYVKMKKVGLQ
jgi:PAS domain S-box-containing protein